MSNIPSISYPHSNSGVELDSNRSAPPASFLDDEQPGGMCSLVLSSSSSPSVSASVVDAASGDKAPGRQVAVLDNGIHHPSKASAENLNSLSLIIDEMPRGFGLKNKEILNAYKITASDVNALSDDELGKLKPSVFKCIMDNQNLTARVLNNLSIETLKSLPEGYVAHLSISEFNNLKLYVLMNVPGFKTYIHMDKFREFSRFIESSKTL